MFGLEEQQAHYAAVRRRIASKGRPEAPPPIKAPAPEPVRPPAPAPVSAIPPEFLWRTPAAEIVKEVCAKYEVPDETIFHVDRRKMIVRPRQEVMYRLHYELRWSLGKIGRYFDKDHSTIAHSIARYKVRTL